MNWACLLHLTSVTIKCTSRVLTKVSFVVRASNSNSKIMLSVNIRNVLKIISYPPGLYMQLQMFHFVYGIAKHFRLNCVRREVFRLISANLIFYIDQGNEMPI